MELSFLNVVPDPMIDEPWYSNTAYNFVHNYYFTNTNVGYSGGDLFCFSSFAIAIFFQVFGFSFLVSRLSSVLAGLLLLAGFIKLLRDLKIKDSIIFYSALLLIFSNVFYVISRTARPEIWVLSMGIWSLCYAHKFYQSKKLKHSMLAGLFAAFSFLAHPYGILSVINAGAMLSLGAIKDKSIRHLFYFGITFLTAFGLPVLFCLSNPAYNTYLLSLEISARNSVTAGTGLVNNLMAFFTAYTLGIKRLYILIFEISILLPGIFVLRKEKISWLFPAIGIFNFTFGILLLSPYSTRSFGQVMVFSVLTFALLLNDLKPEKIKRILLCLGTLYLLNNLAGDIFLVYKKIDNKPFNQLVKSMDAHIPDNKVVISLLEFWYAFPDNEFYSNYTQWYSKKFENLDDLIKSDHIDYIVLSDYFIRGYSATTEREEPVDTRKLEYYNTLLNYAKKSGSLIYELDGGNYGQVKIWKVIK